MLLKYNIEIETAAIETNIKRLTNQIYKLLPSREEEADWQTPLTTIIEELSGMNRLVEGHQETLFTLLCKLEGLFILTGDKDFLVLNIQNPKCVSINEMIEILNIKIKV